MVFSQHAITQWRKRFRKMKRVELLEREAERAKLMGSTGGADYFRTPCGAVLVVERGVVKTVLLERYIPDALHDAIRNY